MFEFLFKYPATVFSKGKLVLLGPWPAWLLLAAIALTAAFLGWLFWRRSFTSTRGRILWLLQSLTLAILLLLLWQPAISITSLRPQQNIVAVLVDDSASMNLADDGAPREQQVIELLQSKLLPKLNAKYQVRLYRLNSAISRVADLSKLKADGAATQIAGGLHQLAEETATLPIGSVVLLSDGSDNAGGIDLATLNELRARRLPVNTVGFGKEQISHDIEVEDFVVPRKVLANARVSADIHIRQHDFTGQHAHLTITADGQLVASRDITLADTPEQIENIEFAAGRSGVRRLQAHIDALPGETNVKNNVQTKLLAIDGTKRRILYIEGEPRWEYKFLRRAVEDDPAVEIVSMLRTTQNKIYRQGIANPAELADGFPGKPEDLFEYQALIIGSIESGYFSPGQQNAIRDFVDRRGGGLLLLGGRYALADGDYNAAPFSQLLPVILPNHKNTFHRDLGVAELTDAGKKSLICRIEDSPEDSVNHWNVLPYLADYQDAGTPKPGALELAKLDFAGKQYPLLVTENYGRGRTALFATGGSWRWKMQQPTADTSQQTFWRQLIRWVAGETPSPVVASVSESRIRAEVRNKSYNPISDATVEADLVTPSGAMRTVPLHPDPSSQGIYTAELGADQPGSYVAEVKAKDLGSDVVTYLREDGVAENFHQEQNRDLLQNLAEATGGRYYNKSNAAKLPDEISFSDSGITMHENMDLWNMPIVFLLLLMLRASEWLLRRRWGLV